MVHSRQVRPPFNHVFCQADIGQRTKPTLGVAVVWVRRRERRRGLATALVDCRRAQTIVRYCESVMFSASQEIGAQMKDDESRSTISKHIPGCES